MTTSPRLEPDEAPRRAPRLRETHHATPRERTQAPPRVSILIPCLDEERHIARVVRQALTQDHPRDAVEVLVADGGSRDRTPSILADLATRDARLTVLHNPKRYQAAGLNLLLRHASGDVFVRMDAHASYPKNYVRACLDALRTTGASAVGGAQRLGGGGPWQKALASVLKSPLASGGARYRDPTQSGWVDTVYLGAYPRTTFERVGLYDAAAVTNEDAELNQRVIEDGGRIWLSREIVAHYLPRSEPVAMFRQYFAYGSGRARTLIKRGRLLSARSAAPFGGLVCALLGLALPRELTAGLALTYATVVCLEAFRVAARDGARHTLRAACLFPLLHAGHALGFAVGLARYLRQPDWSAPERLAPRPEAP